MCVFGRGRRCYVPTFQAGRVQQFRDTAMEPRKDMLVLFFKMSEQDILFVQDNILSTQDTILFRQLNILFTKFCLHKRILFIQYLVSTRKYLVCTTYLVSTTSYLVRTCILIRHPDLLTPIFLQYSGSTTI